MRVLIGGRVLELVLGDVTEQETDAVVNAANSRLAGGGGVDGAIHRRGGPAIMAETARRYPDGCPTGSAVISGAGDLPARWVIHAVGPVWSGGCRGEPELLAAAYCRSIELAGENGCDSVALPSLSTGAYRFPVDQASRIAVKVALDRLRGDGAPSRIRFVLFSEEIYNAFAAALADLSAEAS